MSSPEFKRTLHTVRIRALWARTAIFLFVFFILEPEFSATSNILF